jgi:basic amino acid/polyamine antiporter, APA family
MDLKKGLSFFGVFSIASGAMISSGIFILPGLAYSKAGPAVFISYFLAGVLALLGIFSVIELSTAMPKAGGDYFFINKTFGPMLGTISGFLGWFALSLKSAFAIFGISEIFFLYAGFNPLISGLFLCLFFIIINLVGVKEAAIFQIAMIVVLLSLLSVYVVVGLPKVQASYFSPFLTVDINEIFITSGFIFISFGGLLKVATVSEEVINPKRNIPLGMISSVIVVTIFYTLITYIITGTLPPLVLKESLTPVADSARLILGTPGYIAIIIASILAFITTANAGVMSASRYPLALSRDELLPPQMALTNSRFQTPTIAIVITGLIIYISLLLPLVMLVKAASTVILTSYVLTNISVIILRESKITNYQPSFKAPFYPWLQIACIGLFTFFIIELGAEAIELSLAFLLISVCIYLFYGRKTNKREYALLYLLKRISDRRLTENVLENELREIVINRDNIEQDSFDKLIKQAKIIDIDDDADYEKLLHMAAKTISDEIDMSEKGIVSRFLKRQEECNAAISDFLAIPHIIIDGEDKIFLTIIRSKTGIKFTEKESRVKAVFLLGGTKDKRVLHLKTIASIASLVGKKGFQASWLSAESIIELRNVMLLSSRKRYY